MSRTKLLCAIGMVALLGACAKKKELPPAPPPPPAATSSVNTTPTPPPPPPQVQPSVVPGSLQDFVQTAGADRVFFGYDSYNIDDTAQATLAKQAEWLKRYPNVSVTLEGHCDERGTREYNLALGDRRASAAKSALVSAGVSASRIKTISYGKERPEVTGSSEDAYAQNRRAVAVLANINS